MSGRRAFLPSTTALIVIDMQGDFCESGDTYLGRVGLSVANTRAPIPALQLVLQELRKRKFSIFHTREGHRPSLADCPELKLWRSRMSGCELGSVGREAHCCSRALVRGQAAWDLIDELKPVEGEDVVDGCGKGKFVATDLEMLLRERGVTTLVFGGVTTACCVATTMREAQDLGFECWLLADGTGDCSEKDFMDTLRLSSPRVLSCTTFLTRVLHDYRQSLPAPERAALPEEFDWLPELPAMKSLDGGVDGLPVPFHVWATLEAEMLRGGQLGLCAALGEEARACIRQLKERAAADGLITRDGFVCIPAEDGGRTGAWPHAPATLTMKGTALLCLNARGALAEKHTESAWMIQLRSLELAAKEAGVSVLHMHAMAPYAMEDPSACTMPLASEGAFSGTRLEAELHKLGVRNLLLAGLGAAGSVNTTMRQASDRGFDTLVVADCVGTDGQDEDADLFGLTASQIRRVVFSACGHSDAVLKWLRAETIKRVASDQNAGVGGKRGREK